MYFSNSTFDIDQTLYVTVGTNFVKMVKVVAINLFAINDEHGNRKTTITIHLDDGTECDEDDCFRNSDEAFRELRIKKSEADEAAENAAKAEVEAQVAIQTAAGADTALTTLHPVMVEALAPFVAAPQRLTNLIDA